MRIEFRPDGPCVRYELHDVDPALDGVLRQCFWQHDGGIWHRSYPLSAPHLDTARERFSRHAEEMFRQLAYLSPVRWEEGLLAFAARAHEAAVDWWLTGSVAACLRGVPLQPHDVDIMIDHDDVATIADLFADLTVEPLVDTGGWLTRDFGVLFRHCRIDLASDPVDALDDPEPIDCGPYARHHLETVTFHGFDVRVPPLALTLAANRRRGRHDRVALIQAHLDAVPG